MRRVELQKTLDSWDAKNRRVFTQTDLRLLFPEDNDRTFLNSLSRFSKGEDPLFKRASRGVYVYAQSRRPWTHAVEEVARAMRREHHTYVSLESALSEHGVISQIPIDTLTVVTSGRSGTFETIWGTIEFMHTARPPTSFIPELLDVGRPLRLASPQLALADLTRRGRNLHLVQNLELENQEKEERSGEEMRPQEDNDEPVF